MSDLDIRNIEKLPIDFEEILETLKIRIQKNLPTKWTDFLASNFGVELLEAVAYEATMMFYYNNVSINECFLPTAKTRSGVYNLAKTIGYKPFQATQASTTLRFYLDKEYINNIIIPKYTICSNNTVNFYTIEDTILYAGDLITEVDAKSGNINTDIFISTGIIDYRYKLLNNNVNDILKVTVDNVEYTKIDFIDTQDNQNLYYTVDYDADSFGYISFGDGVYGILPSKNLTIEVIYVTGSDVTNNVEQNTVNSINNVIYDEKNVIINNLLVTNIEQATGASSVESLDEIKKNAPSIYRTQKRCVTRQDYADITLMINGVNKCSVIDNSMLDEIGIYGVKIAVIPDNAGYPSEAFKRDILKVLEERKIIAQQVEIIDPSYITFNVTIGVKSDRSVSTSILSNKIKYAVSEYLSWKNREFGQYVSTSEIYSLISKIQGVNTINSITLEEKRYMYISERPLNGENTCKIVDNMNILTPGVLINIMNLNGISAIIAKIKTYNKQTLECSLCYEDGSDVIFNDAMNITSNCFVYPILYVDGDFNFGSKEILIKDTLWVDNSAEKKNLILLNMSYTTIYFNNDSNDFYQVLFRVGNKLYLNKSLEKDIPSNSKITVLYKKFIPVLSSTSYGGSDTLILNGYPRFGTGANLISESEVVYKSLTVTVYRDANGIDYLEKYINKNEFVKITSIYIDDKTILAEGLQQDYVLINGGIAIQWTLKGQEKVKSGGRYYVDLIIKTANKLDLTNTFKYYVKSINKKVIQITPSLTSTLTDGTTLEYTTDIYQLMPYEIADTGEIIVNVGV